MTQDITPSGCAGDTARRSVLGVAAVAVGALCTACSTYGAKTSAPAANQANPPAADASGTAGGGSGTGGTGGAAAAAPLAATSAVPVGGGTILADRQIVLAQPVAGTFKAFTAVCTHQGCTVSSVDKGLIICPCHGSRFHLADGSVDTGPASRPLAEIGIKVADGQITLA
ncbi:Rieske (2Fe-2S) protein [Catenulispora rubra]|uniref:Rieske (2Fe-2S) protein n=1 Tax=Catenulispora rubra TaxID=280293 RepID=UPI0018921F77|nr:Rieske (2Fe-2S) protein [Catenulispora rubra]